MGYIDLHLHTTNSDGALSPQNLIDEARKVGITTMAITDHNKLLPDYDELQEKNPDIRLIRASEISASHTFYSGKKVEIHIVGLMLDKTPHLVEFLQNNKSDGRKRVIAILKKLKEECHIDLGTYEDIQVMFPEKRVGRMQLAKVLVAHGAAETVTEAFDMYIGDYGERLAWVENPIQFASIKEVVDAIKEAYGIAVLAHPLSYKLNDEELQELLEVFKNVGGHAMEVEYGRYDIESRKTLAAIADKWNLLPSCASDFHGNFTEDRLDHHFAESYFNAIENMQRLQKEGKL